MEHASTVRTMTDLPAFALSARCRYGEGFPPQLTPSAEAGFGGSPVTATVTALARYQMFIGGQWVEASSRDHFESDDPFRAEPWALIPRGTAETSISQSAPRIAHSPPVSGRR
jgi:hypothetical protein